MFTSPHARVFSFASLAIWAGWLLTGCSQTASPPPSLARTASGAVQKVGSGTANTFVTTDATGTATTIGIRLSASALNNTPASDVEVDLPLPPEAAPTAFKDVAINWNAHGHPPPGIYDVPHFDFHFYMMDAATRATITATSSTGLQPPPASQIPTGYVQQAPVIVPAMGVHWIDPSSPEYHGQPFTATFIYGSYAGQLTFVEPMATSAYLQSKPSVSKTIPLPQTYPIAGKLYPTGYAISYDAASDSYGVSLTGLTLR